ncbi:hypothetical protein ACPOL_7045 (plasmid) [Acidisarcina polymorpha]|uniref:Uncharacterized protein n=1 Tax=Acidisarcina polymorpha TaxID=2211140 RepID=A0A2Z5GCB2_9BACT|nr:hypothetical protein ACPOL_7045 [Acidisarcina polymorpha]
MPEIVPLEIGYPPIKSNDHERKNFYNEAYFVADCSLFTSGIFLFLVKRVTLCQYFSSHSCVAVPVAKMFLGGPLIWIGMASIAGSFILA